MTKPLLCASLRRHYPDQVLRVEDIGPPLSLDLPSSPFDCRSEIIRETHLLSISHKLAPPQAPIDTPAIAWYTEPGSEGWPSG